MQLNNVQQVDSGIANVSYGWFNGQSSSIQIPRLNAVALPRLKIQLRFYASMPSNSRYQVLVSNCRSSAKPWNILDVAQDQSPSLAIIANTLDQHLTFLGYSDDWKVTPVTFHLPYKVSIFYTGDRCKQENETTKCLKPTLYRIRFFFEKIHVHIYFLFEGAWSWFWSKNIFPWTILKKANSQIWVSENC